MVPAILAAAALGVLTGYLVGLSASPVVAAVVSALLAMVAGIAALTGLKNPFLKEDDAAAPRGRRHDYSAFAFALATIAAVSAGLWIRNHNLLSPDPAALQAQWQAVGFDRDTAARIALASLTGISIEQEGAATVAAPEGPRASTLLFSLAETEACQRTDPGRAPSADEARHAWQLAPGDWPAFAAAMADADLEALRLFWETVCGDQQE
jgi:hypothetical protein